MIVLLFLPPSYPFVVWIKGREKEELSDGAQG